MRWGIAALLAISVSVLPLEARAANPGDIVRVEAASLTFGGELVSQDADEIRIRLESGVIAIPLELVRSMTVVRAAPTPPTLTPAGAPRAPGTRTPHAVWISRWGSGLTFAAIGGSGGKHDTPVEAKSSARSGGLELGYEHAFPFVAVGGAVSFEQMRESLLSPGAEACPKNAGASCFRFDDGLAHSTTATGALLFAKPYFMFHRVRAWVRAGGEGSLVEYDYSSSKVRYGSGSTTVFGLRYGGGIDLATKRRGAVFTLGVDTGGAHYREKIGRLFGAPWKSDDAGPRSTAVRVELGMTIPLGAR